MGNTKLANLGITKMQTSYPPSGGQAVAQNRANLPGATLQLVGKHATRKRRHDHTPIPEARPAQIADKPCLPPAQAQPETGLMGVIHSVQNIFVDTKKEEIKKQLTSFLSNALSPENLKIIDNPILTSQLNNLKSDENLKENLALILKGYKNGAKSNASIAELLKDFKGSKGAFDEVFNRMVSYANNHTNKEGKVEHYYEIGGYLSSKKGLLRTLLEWGKFDKYCQGPISH